MKVSKIVPVIVSIVLVLAWGLIGYKSALISESLPADPTFLLEVTLKEDIYAINEFDYLGATIDQRTNEPEFEPTFIPAGSVGKLCFSYSYRYDFINDPETDIIRFGVYFEVDGIDGYPVGFWTGPESQIKEKEFSYKLLDNYEEIVTTYNQKIQEAKNDHEMVPRKGMLEGMSYGIGFSFVFFLVCFFTNKFKLHPVIFGILCLPFVIFLCGGLYFAQVF